MKPICLVTGGSRGIGLALVEKFKEDGDAVAAFATTEAGAARGAPDLALAVDISDRAAVDRAVGQTVDQLGGLTVVVNNAGVAGKGADWHRVVDVNLHGTYYVCDAAKSHLPDGRGRVINIASVLALKGVPDQLAYCASKAGVLGLTRALALELAPRGVTVNAVCPGWVATDMADARMVDIGASRSDLDGSVPLGRVLEPVEVAELVLYLASERAAGITGSTQVIDGGALA